jgi:glycosyltransferase involved in cell wall biosynthesis
MIVKMNSTGSRKISVVIACYNSENSLKTVVDEVCNTLDKEKVDHEIILVNDGSSDGTLQVINSLCESNFRVRGIDLSKNFGQQQAMLAGFNFAKGSLVAYCDDDGQSPVSEFKQFFVKIDEGFDMVWAKYPDQKRGFFNGIGASINNRMLKYLFNKPIDLSFGNMWVAKRFVIEEAIKCKNPRVYLGGVFLSVTSNMANVICKQRRRISGDSNYSFLKLVAVWLNGLTAFSIAPLRIASITGGIIAFLGIIYMVYLIVFKLTNSGVLIGYSSIMSVILFIGGMLMMMIGILGEYIGRIYSNMNTLPPFVVKQTININND